MKLINPSFEIIEQGTTLPEIYQHIEKCGKICYKSEHTIKDGSAEKFCNMIADKGHLSVMEHGTIYLKFPVSDPNTHTHNTRFKKYLRNPYSKVNVTRSHYYVTTNMRVLVEHEWLEDLEFLCEPTKYHERRATVKFTCSRGISHELVRHRVFSFSQESQRYCAYNKDQFGSEITFIKPLWYEQEGDLDSSNYPDYGYSLLYAENRYLDLLEQGLKAQEAREVLPNSTKTEVMMTGFISDWQHFFKLRTDKSAHPEMRRVSIPLEEEFKKKGLL